MPGIWINHLELKRGFSLLLLLDHKAIFICKSYKNKQYQPIDDEHLAQKFKLTFLFAQSHKSLFRVLLFLKRL
jgi:hypothetical protein